MLLGEDAIEQGGLAGAEEAGKDGDGNGRVVGHEEETDAATLRWP